MLRLTLALSLLAVAAASALAAAPWDGSDPAVEPSVSARLLETTLPLRDDGHRALQQKRLLGEKAPDRVDAILIMCDFADSLLLGRHEAMGDGFPAPMQTDPYYTAHDAVYFQHLLTDVADYFDAASGGAFTLATAIHPQVINLQQPMAWYGNHPEEGEQSVLLARDVVAAAGAQVDLSLYDAVIVAHAGAGEETDILGNSPEQIFSTYLDPQDFGEAVEEGILDQPYLPAPGFPAGSGVDRVLVLPETARQDPVGGFNGGFGVLGTYCFEVGLHLGMLSLSDFTPSGRPDSQGIGQYGLMGYGLFVGLGFIPPQPCAFNKVLMGWLDPYEIDPGAGAVWSLDPASDITGGAACARVSLTGQEYWLLEYRLQDPDGNRRFSFTGDLNGNGLPDYLDADSENLDGTPTGKFDPATDTHERMTGAEWDFAMSENAARSAGELGAGSGVYIWHVDEGVIQDVFDSPRNLFNADPDRKSVDLEEADGIQDLDSSTPSDFLLGSDDDSFRGEDVTDFGPATRPDTRTASGAATGISFTDFSNVVVDSAAYTVTVGEFSYPGYDYADAMSFRVQPAAVAGAPTPAARRVLPDGFDPSGSHLLVGNLGGTGLDEQVVLAGAAGEIYVLDGDLTEFLDHDGNAATLEPFATGLRGGLPVAWNLPPAMGDLDGAGDSDGEADIVLTGPDAVYVFGADGQPRRDEEAGAFGLFADVAATRLPPVLIPTGGDEGELAIVVVEELADGTVQLVVFDSATAGRHREVSLGAGTATAPPVLWDGRLLVTIADEVGGHRLALAPVDAADGDGVLALPLLGEPGPWPPVVTRAPGEGGRILAVTVVGTDGRGETVRFTDEFAAAGAAVAWPATPAVASPVSPGGACVVDGALLRVGQLGDPQEGWPVAPRPAVSGTAAVPLVTSLVERDGDHYLFSTRDGRIHARGRDGSDVPGWPLAGPARGVSPALGALGGGLELDLVALGVFPRIVGNAAGGDELATETVATLAVWHDLAAGDPVWPMWGGSPLRNGAYEADGFITTPAVASGEGIVLGSHRCYPSPLTEGPLHVQGQVRSAARVRAEVYNLEGEKVGASAWRDVPAVEPFSLEIVLESAGTGMYICRLVAESASGGRDNSVIQMAIVR